MARKYSCGALVLETIGWIRWSVTGWRIEHDSGVRNWGSGARCCMEYQGLFAIIPPADNGNGFILGLEITVIMVLACSSLNTASY